MEQSRREDAGRRTVEAVRRAVRRVLGLDPPAPEREHVDLVGHGAWQVCGVGADLGGSGGGGGSAANGPAANGPAGLRRR